MPSAVLCACADAWAGFKKIGEKLLNFSGKTKKQVGLSDANVALLQQTSSAVVLLKHIEAAAVGLGGRASTACVVYVVCGVYALGQLLEPVDIRKPKIGCRCTGYAFSRFCECLLLQLRP
jgi:hypothetical protein